MCKKILEKPEKKKEIKKETKNHGWDKVSFRANVHNKKERK